MNIILFIILYVKYRYFTKRYNDVFEGEIYILFPKLIKKFLTPTKILISTKEEFPTLVEIHYKYDDIDKLIKYNGQVIKDDNEYKNTKYLTQ